MSIIRHVELTLMANARESASAAGRRQKQLLSDKRQAIGKRFHAQTESIKAQRTEREVKQTVSWFGTGLAGQTIGTVVTAPARDHRANQDKDAETSSIEKERASLRHEDAVETQDTNDQLADGARTFLTEMVQHETQKSEER